MEQKIIIKAIKTDVGYYLTELIKTINCPLVDCPNCKGKGVLVEK